MNKAFSNFAWENYPSENTAVNAENLNKINNAIDIIDSRVVMHETTKLDKTTANTMVKDVTFDSATGVITVTKLNGSVLKIDTKLEKLAVNFNYDSENQRLVITLDDGTTQYVDLKALITQYEFVDGNAIVFTADSNGKITAEIKDGSITADKLDPNILAQINISVSKAESAATRAESAQASAELAQSNAELSASQAEAYKEEAKTYNEQTQGILTEVNKKLELAEFTLNSNGELVYTDDTAYEFSVDENGMLNYSVV